MLGRGGEMEEKGCTGRLEREGVGEEKGCRGRVEREGGGRDRVKINKGRSLPMILGRHTHTTCTGSSWIFTLLNVV